MSEQQEAAKDKDRDHQPWQARTPGAPEDLTGKTAAEALRELQVRQTELEMQNRELTQAQMVLEESRDKYLDLYDLAPVGYFTLTQERKIAEANLAGAAMLGLDRTELVGRGLGRFIAPDDIERWEQHLVDVVHSTKRRTCELKLKRADASTFFARMESVWLDRPAQKARNVGSDALMRVAMSDISDLKLAHLNLTDALSQLARSNSELENFAYVASHDLRGPLITITGFLGRLVQDTEQGDAERMQSDIARIGAATQKMDRLLCDLLELCRIGRKAVSLEDVSLTGLAREVADLLAGPLAEARIRVEIAPDMPTVYGARAQLTQLFMNLISNATKFMGEQPAPQVEIGVRRDGKETVCYVRDSGIGIDPQHKDRIFGLFHQLDPSRGGTGIGLAIAKRVVETHGGRIWLESDGLGKGSTFCFTLVGMADPVIDEEQDNGQRPAARIAG
jgi:PAS domain S-box-containing protein